MNKLSKLTDNQLCIFYKQSVSYYNVRTFFLNDGTKFSSTPEELEKEIKRRKLHEYVGFEV